MGKEEINEAMEVWGIVMQVEKHYNQEIRLRVKMTQISFMPLWSRLKLRHIMYLSQVLFLSVTELLLSSLIGLLIIHMCQFSLSWDLMQCVMCLMPPSTFLPQLKIFSQSPMYIVLVLSDFMGFQTWANLIIFLYE